jgi:ATP phosphoribosyltransferase regulatory subunit
MDKKPILFKLRRIMTAFYEKALLPSGFHDLLPREAAFQHSMIGALVQRFQAYGYDLVNPPLIEFEASLFSGHGDALAEQTFRVLDPLSHQMMGVRADITMQIARIATTRLRNEFLPLRLSYSGPALRVKGTDLYGERQLVQAGIELIGAEAKENADAEVIIVALDSLRALGITQLSVDFNLPGFADILLDHAQLDKATTKALRQALNRKDSGKVATLGGEVAAILLRLLTPLGNADATLSMLSSLALPPDAQLLCTHLGRVITLVRTAHPEVNLTIDVLEYHGFEYYSGIGFAIFSTVDTAEVARGGRYEIDDKTGAVGATIDVNTLLRILPLPEAPERVFIPAGTSPAEVMHLQKEGFVTIHALQPDSDPVAEAKRQQCGYVWQRGDKNKV